LLFFAVAHRQCLSPPSQDASWAQYSWVANDRPNGGYCALQPTSDPVKFFLRCSNWEDRQSDPLTYVVSMTYNGTQLPLSFGQWWAPYQVRGVVILLMDVN
jgi:hypothetical protein